MHRSNARVRTGLLTLVLVAACAPPPSFQPSPELSARASAMEALEQQVHRIGTSPAIEDMLPDVRLISPTRIGGFETGLGHIYPQGARPQRDTILGPESVARWMAARAREHRGPTPFQLRTIQVLACDGAVVQSGVYPVRATGREVTRPFMALWRADGDRELRLASVWLAPRGGESRPGVLASGCRNAAAAPNAARYAARRSGVQVFIGAAYEQGSGSARDGFESSGWTQSLEASPNRYRVGAQGYYRIRPAWNVTGLLAYEPGFKVTGRPPGAAYLATLSGQGVSTAALLVRELGELRLGIGPELTYTRWEWSERHLHQLVEPAEPSSGSSLTPGALLSVGMVRPLWGNVYMDLAGRYRLGGNAAAPGYRDMEGLEAAMSAGSLALGFGRWW